MLLAFDTCLDKTYVAIGEKGKTIDSTIVENHGNTYHSAFLISSIKDLLKKNNLKPNDITEIATDVGPGSFTGIRACMTVAKVMAQELNLKTYGISSLEILSQLRESSEKTLVVLDARKNMAYVWDEEILGAIATENVKEIIRTDNYYVISDDSMYKLFSEYTDKINCYTGIEHNFAEILVKLATKKQAGDWKTLTPLYIQPPPVFGK